MKRNFIPLLAVAFVVAIASTGIFYGLFVGKLKSAPSETVVVAAKPLRPGTVIAAADLGALPWAGSAVPKGMFSDPQRLIGQTLIQAIEEGEPVFESRLASSAGTGKGNLIPDGMRAVSVHVSDSSGVLALLRQGQKVDLQVFGGRSGPGAEPEARTAFQNVAVLSVSPQPEPSSQGNFTAPVVTVLVTPREADVLGLADSYGRIRLALRNPADQGRESKPALPLAAIYRGAQAAVADVAPAGAPPKASLPPVRSEVQLAVRLMSASAEGVQALERYGISAGTGVLKASPMSQGVEIERVLADLTDRRSVDVLSLSNVNAALTRSASVELRGREAGNVRVQFSPFVANGRMKLKVQPELTAAGEGSRTRRLETEVDIRGGRSFVISGFEDTTTAAAGRQLIVLVTPTL